MVPDIRGLMVGVRVFLPITLELGAAATWESTKNVLVKIKKMYLYKFLNEFVQIAKSIFVNHSRAGRGHNIGKPQKCICQNQKLYLSKLQNVFVQIENNIFANHSGARLGRNMGKASKSKSELKSFQSTMFWNR